MSELEPIKYNPLLKLISSLLSFKMWGFTALLALSSFALWATLIPGETWATFNISIYGMAFGLRELGKPKFK